MNMEMRRRAAALLEVLGVYLTGAYLNDKLVEFLVRRQIISSTNPFSLLTVHTTNANLLLASRQLLLALLLIYFSFFVIIVPLNWWHRRRGAVAYGLTRAGHPWKVLVLAGGVTSVLTQWPVLVHTLVDVVHPLGPMAPWRQAFFDMSWHRWQFWLFAGIASYAVIPVVEELLFRGYYQRRLAEDWGDGPAIIGVACLFTFSHPQYLIANAYNITMIISLLFLAIGLGTVFAWTRSLIPSMIAHAMINVPLTPLWQGVLLVVFAIGTFFVWRGGWRAAKQVFRNASTATCIALAVLLVFYAVASHQVQAMTQIAVGMLAVAIALEAMDRQKERRSLGVASAAERTI